MSKKKSAPATPPPALEKVSSDRGEWTRIAAEDWRRRLRSARAVMLQRMALCGLDLSYDDWFQRSSDQPGSGTLSIAALVLDDHTGRSLLPAVAVNKADVDRNITRIGDADTDVSGESLSDLVFGYAMSAAECGFLLGLIAGTGLSWPVVEAMEPSSEPPKAGRP